MPSRNPVDFFSVPAETAACDSTPKLEAAVSCHQGYCISTSWTKPVARTRTRTAQ
jgi:hypothetical protein